MVPRKNRANWSPVLETKTLSPRKDTLFWTALSSWGQKTPGLKSRAKIQVFVKSFYYGEP